MGPVTQFPECHGAVPELNRDPLGMVMRAHHGNVADQHLCLAPGLVGFLGSIDRSCLESMTSLPWANERPIG
jgi:hypothetical protein